MKKLALAAALAAVALMQGACVTPMAKKLSPEDAGQIAKDLVARCGGRFKVFAGADTGQLGGTARASVEVDANCPVPKTPPPAPPPAVVEEPTPF